MLLQTLKLFEKQGHAFTDHDTAGEARTCLYGPWHCWRSNGMLLQRRHCWRSKGMFLRSMTLLEKQGHAFTDYDTAGERRACFYGPWHCWRSKAMLLRTMTLLEKQGHAFTDPETVGEARAYFYGPWNCWRSKGMLLQTMTLLEKQGHAFTDSETVGEARVCFYGSWHCWRSKGMLLQPRHSWKSNGMLLQTMTLLEKQGHAFTDQDTTGEARPCFYGSWPCWRSKGMLLRTMTQLEKQGHSFTDHDTAGETRACFYGPWHCWGNKGMLSWYLHLQSLFTYNYKIIFTVSYVLSHKVSKGDEQDMCNTAGEERACFYRPWHCWRSKCTLLRTMTLLEKQGHAFTDQDTAREGTTCFYGPRHMDTLFFSTIKDLHQLYVRTGHSLKDRQRAMDDRDGWWEIVSVTFVLSARLSDNNDSVGLETIWIYSFWKKVLNL